MIEVLREEQTETETKKTENQNKDYGVLNRFVSKK